MRIRIFLKPESLVKLLSARGREPSWLRIRVGLPSSTFSKLMAQSQSPDGKTVKRIMYHMRGSKWDDIFKIDREGE